jgi:hypothetical protein
LCELAEDPRLADAGLSDERDELDGLVSAHARVGLAQQSELVVAPDEQRRAADLHIDTEAAASAQRAPERDPARLALQLDGLEFLVVDPGTRRTERQLADDERSGRSGSLKARRRVDDVAGRDALAGLGTRAKLHNRLACRHRCAHLETELIRRFQDPQARPNRTLRVVLVRDRSAEHGHHRVADELLHRSTEPDELFAHPLVVGLQRRAHVFRVSGIGARGERDQVDEEHGDGLALLPEHPRAERSAAREAEASPFRVLLRATRADAHRSSVLRRCAERAMPEA